MQHAALFFPVKQWKPLTEALNEGLGIYFQPSLHVYYLFSMRTKDQACFSPASAVGGESGAVGLAECMVSFKSNDHMRIAFPQCHCLQEGGRFVTMFLICTIYFTVEGIHP